MAHVPKNDPKIVPITARHPLVGVWRPVDPELFAEYMITAQGDGFHVRAADRHDGEEFIISSISWDGESLRFVSRMPSTGWVLRNEFRPLGTGDVDHRFARREVLRRSDHARLKEVPVKASNWLVGAWESPDEDESLVITVRAVEAAFKVGAVDRDDGETLLVSDIRWDGHSLRFMSLMPSINRHRQHELRALSESEVEHVFAEHERCIKLD